MKFCLWAAARLVLVSSLLINSGCFRYGYSADLSSNDGSVALDGIPIGRGDAGVADAGPDVEDSGVLPTANCSNGVHDDQETDIDCGGPECNACALSLNCSVPSDCASNTCTLNRCVPATLELVAGGYFNCAYRPSQQLYCWGRNDHGEIGDGTIVSALSPVPVPGMTQVAQLGLGREHSCAVTPSGQAFCWGLNNWGQVGNALIGDRLTPTAVVSPMADFGYIAGSADGTVAVRQNGTLAGWGNHQLGAPPSSVVPVDKSAMLSSVGEISGGSLHFCARQKNGTVWCWGDGNNGRLGNGSVAARSVPTQVTGITQAADVKCGEEFTCARLTDGTVWCWGDNAYHQMGQGGTDTTPFYSTPIIVPGITDAVGLDVGAYHACVTLRSGELQCWGLNREGELGTGDTVDRPSPVTVPGLTQVSSVAAGAFHTCAVRQDSQIYCWGLGNFGQIGDGNTNRRLSPTPISIP